MATVHQILLDTVLEAPAETLPAPRDGFDVPIVTEVNPHAVGLGCVIWAAGFAWDFNLVQAPVFDGFGYPVQTRGITAQPGLYFVGLPWLHSAKSSLLVGVGEDAEFIAAHIAGDQDPKGL